MDEAARRILIEDGEGMGDERRLSSVYKQALIWLSQRKQHENNPETIVDFDAISLATLDNLLDATVLARRHATLKNQAAQRQMEMYKNMREKISAQMTEAQERIADCKKELAAAKQIRRNRQEYDALAKIIQTHENRDELNKKLAEAEQEISYAETQQKSLIEKLELRKKQFHVLMVSLQEMQALLDDDLADKTLPLAQSSATIETPSEQPTQPMDTSTNNTTATAVSAPAPTSTS